ncbi:MAG: adenosine deaminase [Chloroflexi bacterium]|nr:adenosine deaminase [Chloroflexota bacterium]
MQTAFIPPEPSEVLLQMPKCNIHTHLEGSVRPETFLELAAKNKVKLPFDPAKVDEKFRVDGAEKTLVEYLNKIRVNYAILHNREALYRTSYEAAEDAHRDGVIYLELRDGPALHSTPDFPVEACVESMLAGLQEAEAKFGIVCRLIVAGLRDHDPQVNVDLARIAGRLTDQGVVGFDLAGDEAGYPASLHRGAVETAREMGLGITVHAGEAAGAENVRYAVEVLGAQRIGHGVRSIESRVVMDLLKKCQILLEICPTSNVHTGTVPSIEEHPLKTLYDYGIPISINDDDPITSRTRVSNELMLLQTVFGMPLETLQEIQLATLDHTFLREEKIRARLKSKVLEFAVIRPS